MREAEQRLTEEEEAMLGLQVWTINSQKSPPFLDTHNFFLDGHNFFGWTQLFGGSDILVDIELEIVLVSLSAHCYLSLPSSVGWDDDDARRGHRRRLHHGRRPHWHQGRACRGGDRGQVLMNSVCVCKTHIMCVCVKQI